MGDELLPSETYTASTTIACLHIDFCFVDEFHEKKYLKKRGTQISASKEFTCIA
jgi:hypothetical protein